MSRRNRTPEEQARRTKIRELLQISNIGSMDDIQKLFKETIAEFMENGLECELDEELGYSKYDYRNKQTDNSRNGYSNKTLNNFLCRHICIFFISIFYKSNLKFLKKSNIRNLKI